MSKRMKRILALIAVCCLLQSEIPSAIAAQQNTGTAIATEVKPVYYNGNVFSVRDAHILMQERGRVLAFTLTIFNNGNQDLDLTDYWVRVKNGAGRSFKATLIDTDKSKTSVPAKSSQNLTYYAILDGTTKLQDISLDLVVWDFDVAGYERTIGTMKLNAQAFEAVKAYDAKVMLYESTKIRSAVKQFLVNQDGDQAYLTINFLVENVGFQSTTLSKALFMVKTESETVFDVTNDLANVTIQPAERMIVTLQATVPASVAAKPLSLVFASTDSTGLKIPAGVFALPTAKTFLPTPAGQERVIFLGGQTVSSQVSEAFLAQDNDQYDVTVELSMQNTGTRAVQKTALEYVLRSAEGDYYPLESNKTEVALLPKESAKMTLSGKIPDSVNLNGLELVVQTASGQNNKTYAIGSYKLQASKQEGRTGTSFKYGHYEIGVDAFQRIPWTDDDLIAAEITIRNVSNDTKAIPQLSGYFIINGIKVSQEKTSIVPLDQTISIGAGQTYKMVAYVRVPYTTSVDKLSFVLTETVDQQTSKALYQFTSGNTVQIRPMTADAIYEIRNTGNQSSVQIQSSGIFNGNQQDLFYAELILTNEEPRSAAPVKLGGIVQNSAGQTIPVNFTEYKGRVLPDGKILISAWAGIPKNFEKNELTFIIGQSVKGSSNAEADGIVKAAAYNLKLNDMRKTKNDFNNIQFAGYEMTLKRFVAQLYVIGGYTVGGLQLSFEYDLARDSQFANLAEGHKIMIEFVNDDTNRVTYAQEFEIGSGQADGLNEGSLVSRTIIFNDSDIQSKIQSYQKYTINVYDVFEGTRLLLATKQLQWFVVSS